MRSTLNDRGIIYIRTAYVRLGMISRRDPNISNRPARTRNIKRRNGRRSRKIVRDFPVDRNIIVLTTGSRTTVSRLCVNFKSPGRVHFTCVRIYAPVTRTKYAGWRIRKRRETRDND